MSTRLDHVIQKFPEQEAGIRALAARDPSSTLKYLDWGAKVLAAGQALAPEVADILDLFHQFAGQRIGGDRTPAMRRRGRRHAPTGIKRIHPDIYAYRPQDLADLRGNLLKVKRARDQKRRKRERLYHLDGPIEAEVIYDATDLVVRHIKNKQACVHYGLGTKWCIAMLREGYFEDYESHNATFFFFERRVLVGDEFDKVALMVPRSVDGTVVEAFTALDRRVDMMVLAKAYGLRVFDIFRDVHVRSERYPGSDIFHVYASNASASQVEAVFASVKQGEHQRHHFKTREILEAICCNDAAPWPVLDEIARNATELFTTAWKRSGRRGIRKGYLQDLERTIEAALVIHPNVPAAVRETITKKLRRRHVKIDAIHRVMEGDHVSVSYRSADGLTRIGRHRFRHYRRRKLTTVKAIRARAQVLDRKAARLRKSAKRLQHKLTEAKKKARAKKAKRS